METSEIKAWMNSGEIYYENAEILAEQAQYRDLLFQFNHTLPSKTQERQEILQALLGSFGKGSYIEAPFSANWGKNTYFGKHVYANSHLTLVDDTKITIGDSVMMGPNVTLCTGTHPLEASLRQKGAQYNLPVTIEKGAWLGAGVTVLPGVTIGENSVIGAHSLVTQDIPANVVAYDNPCRVIRPLPKEE
ncbi:hypothetical protein UAS_00619 [Enterococcus asini ATCC 700915]|uniref:Acetyltransferase n=1 Tax=Enterococcus asini ATCC 700915 TaxID=1158606 RepID=R2S0Q7_9ENTE|nr:sugar O-acetyltransferase [Enterococcus asini]EOH89080.1 hypothetical protein UAS_00619 [Enterococcus asini ATCC 700915]EOT55651.1 hypothetical protein I579_02014 [Enterococcus asini ATCC 700915]OJG12930.1 hypothetical protein RU94_GL001629 [Enterococcus asini]